MKDELSKMNDDDFKFELEQVLTDHKKISDEYNQSTEKFNAYKDEFKRRWGVGTPEPPYHRKISYMQRDDLIAIMKGEKQI